MEPKKLPEALSQSHQSSSYQTKLLISLSLSIISFSSYIFSVPFLISDDPLSPNMTNYFILLNKDYYIRTQISSSSYLSIPIGALIYSTISDKIGRKKQIKYFLMWIIVFNLFLSISLTTHVVVLCSCFIGSFSLSGVVSIVCYLNESIAENSRVLANLVILLSLWLSLFFTTLLYYFYFNWRTVAGISLVLALAAFYLVDSLAESVEWVYAKEGPLEAEVVLKKMAGDWQLELELEDVDEGAGQTILNAGARFGLACDWVNFALLFGWILALGLQDLYIDKLSFGLLAVLGLLLTCVIGKDLSPGSVNLIIISSRASVISQALYPNYTLLLIALVLSQAELAFLITKTERLFSPLSKSKTLSNLLIFSFISSYCINTSQLPESFCGYLLILLTLTSKLFSPLFPQSQLSFFYSSVKTSNHTNLEVYKNHLV